MKHRKTAWAVGMGLALASWAAQAQDAPAAGNQRLAQSPRIERSYPLAGDAERAKSAQVLQQLVVDLLSAFNGYKEVHWNLSGPLYLVLHEYYQSQADFYRKQADVFAERALQLGYSIDGRYSTIAKTTKLADLPAGFMADDDTIKLTIDRIATLQKQVYAGIEALDRSDPVTANKLQDLAYSIDQNLWQLRIHLARPGSNGQALPWAAQQQSRPVP